MNEILTYVHEGAMEFASTFGTYPVQEMVVAGLVLYYIVRRFVKF